MDSPPLKSSDLEAPTAADRTFALVSHLSVLAMPIIPCLGPYICWRIARGQGSLFKRFHSLQATYFHMGVTIAGWLAWPLAMVLPCGLLLVKPLIGLFVVLSPLWAIYAGWRGIRGGWYNYPFAGAAARLELGVPSMLDEDTAPTP